MIRSTLKKGAGMNQKFSKSALVTFFCIFIIPAQKTDASTNSIAYNFTLYDSLAADNSILAIKSHLDSNAARIMSHLNVTCSDTFTFHIWNNEENYYAAMEKKIGARYTGSDGYVYGPHSVFLLNSRQIAKTAEHEFSHCVSLHLKSSFANNPRWLWESVACYESGQFQNPRYLTYLTSGNYPTISELNGDYFSGYKIYELGYTIAEFILKTFGKEKYVELIMDLGDIQKVLNVSVTEFEEKFKNYVDSTYLSSSAAIATDSIILGTGESGTNRTNVGGYWFWYSDQNNSGKSIILNSGAVYDSVTKYYSPLVPSKNEGNIYGTSGFGALLSFKLVKSAIYMPYVGIGLTAFNFTGLDSISFWAKASPDISLPDYRSLSYEVKLQAEGIVDGSDHAKAIQPTTKWQRYVFAFSDIVFRQPSWAIQKKFDLAKIQSIIFSVSGFVDTSLIGNLWIDDVVVYGKLSPIVRPIGILNKNPTSTHHSSQLTLRRQNGSLIAGLPSTTSASLFSLRTMSGKTYFTQLLPANSANHEVLLNIPTLAHGLYIIELSNSKLGRSAVPFSIVR